MLRVVYTYDRSMSQHPNARLTPRSREAFASYIGFSFSNAETVRQMGVSRQAVSKRSR